MKSVQIEMLLSLSLALGIYYFLASALNPIVIANFTTHGRSHIYGLPCPSANSLDPMDHFCIFDVSKIIPKNMSYLLYATFKPILAYMRGFDP